MLEFYEKRKLKRVVYSKPVLLLVGGIVVLLFFPTLNAYSKMQNTYENKNAVAQELLQLQEREEALQGEINRLSTEQGVEAEIRKKFEVGRDGEELIVIVGEEKSQPQTEEEPVEEEKNRLSNFMSL